MRELVAIYAWITAPVVAIYAWITSTIHSFLGITSSPAAWFAGNPPTRAGPAAAAAAHHAMAHLMALVMGMCVGDGLTIKPSSVTSTRT